MNLIPLFAIASGLAMDSFAVSVSAGTILVREKFKTAVVLGIVFGFFQGLMPVIGWTFGMYFSFFVADYAHLIAFFLLGAIGIKMIQEGLFKKSGEERLINIQNPHLVLLLGIATSIDALAVGISFALLNESVIVPAIIIGLIAFFASFAGVYLGNKLGAASGTYAETAGGLILIIIGLKIFFEHIL
ncbi:MAG: manganese efflux pump MntP family protein [Methanomicrobium sp.]|nr:manganese efflux pump MntP family protein [Methanomicrobium sp.]